MRKHSNSLWQADFKLKEEEAFHKAYVFEAWMFDFIHYWNYERPQQEVKNIVSCLNIFQRYG